MLAFALALTMSALAAPEYEAEYIFPPLEKHSHGSSIVELPNGDLLAAWFHGSGERTADDVVVQGARKRDGVWSEVFLMADSQDLPDCNPVLFLDPQGTLWLFWIAVQSNEWGSSLLKLRKTTDYLEEGAPRWQWQDVIHTRPQNLEEPFIAMLDNAKETLGAFLEASPDLAKELEFGYVAANDKLQRRLGWMTRIAPIMTQSNRMLLGLYSDVFNCSLAAYTDDFGATWHCSHPILDPKAINIGNVQPAFVQKKDGTIVAYMRDNGIPNYVRRATSTDNGETWSNVDMLDIRDSGASVAALALPSGHWILVNNDLIKGRHRLNVHLSDDEGETWKWARPLEEVEPEQGGFSYPGLMIAKDGAIHATYTFDRKDVTGKTIKHARFNEEWIMEAPVPAEEAPVAEAPAEVPAEAAPAAPPADAPVEAPAETAPAEAAAPEAPAAP
ncbi:MAG: neuraminidase (sialidase)-like protein [Candidatus Hydrogenedens sp.]|nr:neuraminidase (sialidase)-like protein [Candidatus Hydrogenedens sp.]